MASVDLESCWVDDGAVSPHRVWIVWLSSDSSNLVFQLRAAVTVDQCSEHIPPFVEWLRSGPPAPSSSVQSVALLGWANYVSTKKGGSHVPQSGQGHHSISMTVGWAGHLEMMLSISPTSHCVEKEIHFQICHCSNCSNHDVNLG